MARTSAPTQVNALSGDGETRRLILDVAAQEIASLGYHGLKIAVVCRKAGVANGTFYLYFRNKDEVFNAVVEEANEALRTRLRATRDLELSAEERDAYDVQLVVDFMIEHEALFRAMMSDHGISQLGRSSMIDRFAAQRADEIRRGLETGAMQSDVDPVVLAYVDVGLTTEVVQRWIRTPRMMSRARLIEELIKVRKRLLFGGPSSKRIRKPA
jgi:AcrR family transcriptional regulator